MGLSHEQNFLEEEIYIANKHMKRYFPLNNDQRIAYHAIVNSILYPFDYKNKMKTHYTK